MYNSLTFDVMILVVVAASWTDERWTSWIDRITNARMARKRWMDSSKSWRWLWKRSNPMKIHHNHEYTNGRALRWPVMSMNSSGVVNKQMGEHCNGRSIHQSYEHKWMMEHWIGGNDRFTRVMDRCTTECRNDPLINPSSIDHWSIDPLISQSMNPLIDRSIDQLIHRSTDWSINQWSIDPLIS